MVSYKCSLLSVKSSSLDLLWDTTFSNLCLCMCVCFIEPVDCFQKVILATMVQGQLGVGGALSNCFPGLLKSNTEQDNSSRSN